MPTGWLETVGTVFDLALDNAPYKSIKRGIQRSYADYVDDEIIPMAELNEKYSSIGFVIKLNISCDSCSENLVLLHHGRQHRLLYI